MLVAAAGNTALQSVMPAIGREIGIADFYVAIAYTWSAVLWVLLAPFWAEKSDHHGRKALTMIGVAGFILSSTLCGIALFFGLRGMIGGALTFSLFAIFRLRDAVGDPSLSGVQDAAQREGRGTLRAILVVRPGHDHRSRRRAIVRAAAGRAVRTVVCLCGDRRDRLHRNFGPAA